ncbi:hypothetical protein ATY79_18310 [Rhizobium sp. R693]|nr:hypothetical protein ATY79_18310 [Rhizobium sp. R693]
MRLSARKNLLFLFRKLLRNAAHFPHSIVLAVANSDYDCDGLLLRVASTRRSNGNGTWAVLPVFAGLPGGRRGALVRT